MEDATLFRIVCLCGSAGGLEAYRDILGNVPADTGMAFIVVSHRGPDGIELLPQLLRSVTDMPVVEAAEGLRLEPNRVFVMPPRVHMSTDGVVLHIMSRPKLQGRPVSITTFLLSLGARVGARAIAVILSGRGEDGCGALGAIKSAGGVTFAQSNARHDSMPLHAVDTGHVDFTLASTEIAKALVALAHSDLNIIKAFPRKLDQAPACELTTQWHEHEYGKTLTRYSGADGLLYEFVEEEGWYAVGRA